MFQVERASLSHYNCSMNSQSKSWPYFFFSVFLGVEGEIMGESQNQNSYLLHHVVT